MHPNVENMLVALLTKRKRIITISKFLILRKIVEKKAFPSNPIHQCHVSQYGEHDCSATNKKNADYYKYPSLSPFTNEL